MTLTGILLASSMDTEVDTSVPENLVEAALTGAVVGLVHFSFSLSVWVIIGTIFVKILSRTG